MSLHLIRALDHVIEEYADYPRTEFRAKDLKLRAALEAELDASGFLVQEPFYQAHRPFKNGSAWAKVHFARLDTRIYLAKSSGWKCSNCTSSGPFFGQRRLLGVVQKLLGYLVMHRLDGMHFERAAACDARF